MKTNDNGGDICQTRNYERQVKENREVKWRERAQSENKTTQKETEKRIWKVS